jgi:hypothetical protein
MRRVVLALLFAPLFVCAVAACGEASPATETPLSHGGPSAPGTPEAPNQADKTITVTFSFVHHPNDPIFTEGAVTEVRLLDDQGNEVATKTTMIGKPIRFTHLRPGTYRLEPAKRPCDANCGYLDGRLDGCRSTIKLVDSMQVKVEFEVGSPCRISI